MQVYRSPDEIRAALEEILPGVQKPTRYLGIERNLVRKPWDDVSVRVALAFPDALVWAKLSDAVILISFAGQTTAPELKEAKERFARIKARVLGAVLSNVPVDQNLYRYGYGYRARGAQSARNARKSKKLMLPTYGEDGGATKG